RTEGVDLDEGAVVDPRIAARGRLGSLANPIVEGGKEGAQHGAAMLDRIQGVAGGALRLDVVAAVEMLASGDKVDSHVGVGIEVAPPLDVGVQQRGGARPVFG